MAGNGGRNPAAGLAPRVCPTCDARYQPYRDSQRTCSRNCRAKLPDVAAVASAHRMRPEVRERKNAARRIATNPARREVNLQRNLQRYGITAERYGEMLAEQGGRCAICRAEPDPAGRGSTSRLHVDHDHETGAVRALLCNHCNQGLGYFRDRVDLLQAAASYLAAHEQAGPGRSDRPGPRRHPPSRRNTECA